MKFTYPEGATPLNPSDEGKLIPEHIKTQKELNEWEQENILKAERWLFSRRKKTILSNEFMKSLHHKMFDQTWRWAGQFRLHQTNIGIESHLIPVETKKLCDDVEFWLNEQTYPVDEAAWRFHHRLVQIHPFPGGNGRHGRLMADALLVEQNRPKFTWGNVNLVAPSETRKLYISALHQADAGDYAQLSVFVRR